MLRSRWTPSPCGRLSRPRTTTGPPPHPGGISRRRTFPPGSWQLTGFGTTGMVPTFPFRPFDGIGTQLCPCNIAVATPQTFTTASRPATSPSRGVPRTSRHGCALPPGPYPPDLSRWNRLEELSAAGSSRMPLRLACRTRTIWQYRSVPALSGLLPALTPVPGIGLPSASPDSLRRAGGGVLSSPHGQQAPRGARYPTSRPAGDRSPAAPGPPAPGGSPAGAGP